MRLTQGQLRRMIVREAKKVLQEVDTSVATPKVGTGINTGDVSAEKIVHDFFKTLHDGGKAGLKFRNVIIAAQDAYEDWGKEQAEKEKQAEKEEEPAPQTQRSPVKSERLLRNYLKTLLEVLGDENDFRAKFPDLSSLVKFYMDNGNLWMLPYDKDEMQKVIFDRISEVYGGYAGFVGAMNDVGDDFNNLAADVDTDGKIINYVTKVFLPAVGKLNKDMPSGEGMGWLSDPRLQGSLGGSYKEPAPTHPAKPVSANYPTQRAPKPSASGLPLTYPPTKKS
jgi:hypothetical protein